MNVLSFSENIAISLEDLVRQALTSIGCSQDKLHGLDSHSTIIVEMKDTPDLMISIVNDRLWIWSALSSVCEENMEDAASKVLKLLTEGMDGVETGQLILAKTDQGYELKGLVDVEWTRQEGLETVIESFHERLTLLCNLLNYEKGME
ncbi:hypothetical protein WAE56_20730 [Iodobacter sp. LRB]|uniref:InvB/SpaK family type III secretion system chaperone n=1 Tax=unclassified Iodobacter TaxID=235634 RepID=UPI000C0D1C79|nr:hypothetical protein [Iodobacter sp. BJB302]PHU99557.1 hypothetical protein CSQ88_21875 [Iodobacter sp. BJB302]